MIVPDESESVTRPRSVRHYDSFHRVTLSAIHPVHDAMRSALNRDILYNTIPFLDDETLLVIRHVSREFKKRAETKLMHHIVVRSYLYEYESGGRSEDRLAISTPHCRLPWIRPRAYPTKRSDSVHSNGNTPHTGDDLEGTDRLFALTRILDIVDLRIAYTLKDRAPNVQAVRVLWDTALERYRPQILLPVNTYFVVRGTADSYRSRPHYPVTRISSSEQPKPSEVLFFLTRSDLDEVAWNIYEDRHARSLTFVDIREDEDNGVPGELMSVQDVRDELEGWVEHLFVGTERNDITSCIANLSVMSSEEWQRTPEGALDMYMTTLPLSIPASLEQLPPGPLQSATLL